MLHLVDKSSLVALDFKLLIFTYYARMQYSYFWPIMLNVMLMRKLVALFIPNQYDY